MMIADDGGSGGPITYHGHTQREILAAIGSVDAYSVDHAETVWRDAAASLREINELIEQRLKALLDEKEGWRGDGADIFRAVITADLLNGTERISRAADANAAALEPVNRQVGQAMVSALMNDIPWDNDTQWRVDREHQDQTLFGKVDEFVTGDDDDLQNRQKNAAYVVLDGANGQRARREKPDWEALQSSTPIVPPPSIFTKTETPVTQYTHYFDRMMEGLGLNSTPRENVRASAQSANTAMTDFTPTILEEPKFVKNDVTGRNTRPTEFEAPVRPDFGSSSRADSYRPPLPSGSPTGEDRYAGDDRLGSYQPRPSDSPAPESDERLGYGGPDLGGPGGHGGSGGPVGGGSPHVPDLGSEPHPGWADDASKLPVDEPGTRAAGVDTMPRGTGPTITPSLNPNGPGAPGLSGPTTTGGPLGPGVRPGLITPNAPGLNGPGNGPGTSGPGRSYTPGSRLGGTGTNGSPQGGRPGQGPFPTKAGQGGPGGPGMRGGASGPFSGRSGSSFSMGPNGKGIVNPGNVGPMAGSPMGGRGSGTRDEEKRVGHQSWLEEDGDVWFDRDDVRAGDL
ncbi:hypothetical protein GCM10027418_31090 [Mariniluteicoccus endophyticus]